MPICKGAVVGRCGPGLAKGAAAQALPGRPRGSGPMPMNIECEELFLMGEEQGAFGGLFRLKGRTLPEQALRLGVLRSQLLLFFAPIRCVFAQQAPGYRQDCYNSLPPPPPPQRKFHRVSWRELRLRESPSAAVSDCPRSASFSFSRKTEECGQKLTSRNPDSSLPTFVERGERQRHRQGVGLGAKPQRSALPFTHGQQVRGAHALSNRPGGQRLWSRLAA